MTTPQPAITIGDEVLYPAAHPKSGFLSKVIAIDGAYAWCKALRNPNEYFTVPLAHLRLNRTEGS